MYALCCHTPSSAPCWPSSSPHPGKKLTKCGRGSASKSLLCRPLTSHPPPLLSPLCSALRNSTTLGRKLLTYSDDSARAGEAAGTADATTHFGARWHAGLHVGSGALPAQGSRRLLTIK